MTEAQISKLLGLTKAAIGYHLHHLLKAGLVQIEKTEPEEHGILQKFYSPVAKLFIVDPERTPEEMLRFSAFQLKNREINFSAETLEKLALAMLKKLCEVGRKYAMLDTAGGVLSLEVKIYAEALSSLTKQDEWRDFFQKLLYL